MRANTAVVNDILLFLHTAYLEYQYFIVQLLSL